MSSLRAQDPPQQRISGDERDFVTMAEPLRQSFSVVFGPAEPFQRGERLRHDMPTLFSMYVNDLPSAITCAADTILYADDTTIYAYSKSVSELTKLLTSAIKEVDKWMTSNQLRLNIAKSKCMLLHSSRRKNVPPLQLNYNIVKILNKSGGLNCWDCGSTRTLPRTTMLVVLCLKFLGRLIYSHISPGFYLNVC